MTLPCRLQRRGGRTRIIDDGGRLVNTQTAPDPILIKALIAAHEALCGEQGRLGAVEDLVLEATPSSAYDRLRCKLAFLAPDIQKMILEGRQGAHINLAHLLAIDLPGSWNDQRRMLQIPC